MTNEKKNQETQKETEDNPTEEEVTKLFIPSDGTAKPWWKTLKKNLKKKKRKR